MTDLLQALLFVPALYGAWELADRLSRLIVRKSDDD